MSILCLLLQGYVKRQAVFACNTCTPSAAEPAGICLACANKCHDGHDIFELYTKRYFCSSFLVCCTDSTLIFLQIQSKSFFIMCPSSCFVLFFFWCRHFRCDCGNSKFGEFKCQLIPVSALVLILPLTGSVPPPAWLLIKLWSLTLFHLLYLYLLTGQRWGKR